MKRVTSRRNPLVARYRSVALGEVADLLLLDGTHLIAEALAAGIRLCQVVVTAEALGRRAVRELAARLDERHVETLIAAQPVMDAISPVRSSSGIVAIGKRPVCDEQRMFAGAAPLVLITAEVQDPGNLGAIVRVAEAAGVVAAGSGADPFGWKALRGSMGSAFRLPLASTPHADQAVAHARRHACRIVVTLPQGGRSVFDVDLRSAVAVLIGGEGAGLQPALIEGADERVTIPMARPVESLNAAVTAALIVYEASRQRAR